MEYHLQLELWRGNIAGAVQIARQRNELSDWIVAMAPLASHDLWELVSAEYAEQLEEDGQYHKAATYLLAAHKVYQAIDLFRRHRLFREAVSLARIRLSPVDPLLEDLYTEWGQNLMKDGLFEQAAKCYLAMRHIQEAGKALTRRYDQTSLKTACHMTLLVNDKQQGLSYAYKLFTQNLLMGEWQEAYKFLAEHNSLKVLLPLLSTHELLIHHLSIMCPSMVLTQKPVTKASFSQWCKTDDMKSTISLPEFLVDRSDVDPVVPWEPYLIGGHTFPHHLLRVWHQHLDITMVTQELMAMHTAISQLISLRQNLGDLPNLLILVSMDITLCLLVLLTSETSSAIVHLLQAMSTLHSSGNRLLLQALCRLILPQGPKYMLKLQQEFNASRVLITMESHGDVDKAGGEGHNSIKKFVTDIKEDSAITMSSPRCRELDCLRAFYYLAVLDYLHNSCSSTQQEEDILDGMPNRQNLSRDNIKVDLKETKNSGSDMVDVVSKGCDITMNVNPTHNSLTASSVYQTIVTDFSNIGKTCSNSDYCAKNSVNFSHCTVSPSSASSSLPTLLLPGSRSPTDSSSPVDPPSVPSSVHQTQSTVHPSTTSHQSILVGTATSKPATASEEPSLPGANGSSPVMTGKGHDYKGQLNHKNLLRLSKGILWDVQAKREALTETLGHIHSAIAQHLLANRSEEMSKSTSALSPTNCSRPFMSPLDGELEADGCCHQSRHFTLPSQSLSPTAFSVINSAAVKTESILCSANTPQTVLDAVATSFTKVDDQVSSSGDNVSLDRARLLSPQPTVKSSDKVNRGPFRSKSENSASNLSVQLDTTVSPQVETELLNSFEGTSVAFQKTKKILWLDNSRRSMDESLGSPQPTISKLTPDGNVIPVEWVDLPVDVRYIQPYLTLPLLKHEQDIVTQELKRLPDASKVPFPCTSTSVRRLLEACLSSPHLSKEQKVSYFKQLNDWAMLFAVTTHQQHETNTMFSDAFADYFKH
ncbi:Gem-associated protein 5 [Biomphalaria glabrata]|nr:gem-associated protein 5-like isoform X2 [Biomphalaria glabrata]